ncbi:carboxymuconolactone decarboxylase family protein [Chloroflexota bacterium]
MSTLPQDVYQESGFRLPLPKRDEMDEHGKKMYDKTASRNIRSLQGNSGINLYSPMIAEYETALNQYLRFESGLSGPVRELAILVISREMDSQHIWTAHEPMALKEGLSQEIIDIVKYHKAAGGLPETEELVIQLGRELFRQQKVTSETFARALNMFGARQLVNLVTLIANYAAVAIKFRAFDMQVRLDETPLLPIP